MRQLTPEPVEADLFTAYAQDDPGVRVNFVSSLDGAATLDGRSEGLSGPADKRIFRTLRTIADVVLVGAGTVRTEGYRPVRLPADHQARRRSQGRPAVPPLAVVSASLDLDPASPLFTEATARTLVLTGDEAPADRRAALSTVADVLVGDSVTRWLQLLADRGLTRVLCEGGPRLFGSLLAEDRVDELCLTLTPLLARQDSSPPIAARVGEAGLRRLTLAHVLEEDGFLFLRYAGNRAE